MTRIRDACLACKAPGWDPVAACPTCGYHIEYTLVAPSTDQGAWWFKHGVDVITTPGTYTIQASMAPATNTSRFAPGLNLEGAIRFLACSGSQVVPTGNRHGGKPSMIFCVGTTTGSGLFGGTRRIFTGIRAANIDGAARLHFYPDNVDPLRDLAVECPNCRCWHATAALPPVCPCGIVLTR